MADGDGSRSWLGKMEQLLDPDGCSNRNAGVLPEHLNAGLSRLEQAEDFAAHISSISREYVPLTCAQLPDRVTHALDHAKDIRISLIMRYTKSYGKGRSQVEFLVIWTPESLRNVSQN